MRRILILTGVLGGGTALTFGAAVMAASLFPHGTVVSSGGWVNGGVGLQRDVNMRFGGPMPVPGGVIVEVGPGVGADGVVDVTVESPEASG